jgi:hypothetical protein
MGNFKLNLEIPSDSKVHADFRQHFLKKEVRLRPENAVLSSVEASTLNFMLWSCTPKSNDWVCFCEQYVFRIIVN